MQTRLRSPSLSRCRTPTVLGCGAATPTPPGGEEEDDDAAAAGLRQSAKDCVVMEVALNKGRLDFTAVVLCLYLKIIYIIVKFKWS